MPTTQGCRSGIGRAKSPPRRVAPSPPPQCAALPGAVRRPRGCYYGTQVMSTAEKPPRKRIIPRPKTAAERQARIREILRRLDEMYRDATCALIHRTPWELLVATILSAQCTDKRVNEVTPGLFKKYPTIVDFAHASQAELAQDIRSTGFFNNKSRSLIGAAKKILADFGGK